MELRDELQHEWHRFSMCNGAFTSWINQRSPGLRHAYNLIKNEAKLKKLTLILGEWGGFESKLRNPNFFYDGMIQNAEGYIGTLKV